MNRIQRTEEENFVLITTGVLCRMSKGRRIHFVKRWKLEMTALLPLDSQFAILHLQISRRCALDSGTRFALDSKDKFDS